MCVDMYVDMCVDMCVDIRVDVCVGMCVDMCADMCIVKRTYSLSNVQDQGNGFVIVGGVSRLGRAVQQHRRGGTR